jgi:YD repeat-containing protein
MRRAMLVMAVVALLAGGCDLVTAPSVSGGPGCRKLIRQGAVDYRNFVKLNGITYTADRPVVGRTLGDSDLGPVHARVRCSLQDKMDPTGGEPQDGDAAYLEAGSPLYRVRGYRPTFRLAARQDGRLILFEADTNPRARVGRDLLDLEGKVRRISINSRADGRSELGAITDPQQVAAMVRMLLGGPVDQRIQPTSEQHGRLVAFHLRDGTATVRTYDPAERRVERGILVPRRFGELVEAAGS